MKSMLAFIPAKAFATIRSLVDATPYSVQVNNVVKLWDKSRFLNTRPIKYNTALFTFTCQRQPALHYKRRCVKRFRRQCITHSHQGDYADDKEATPRVVLSPLCAIRIPGLFPFIILPDREKLITIQSRTCQSPGGKT